MYPTPAKEWNVAQSNWFECPTHAGCSTRRALARLGEATPLIEGSRKSTLSRKCQLLFGERSTDSLDLMLRSVNWLSI